MDKEKSFNDEYEHLNESNLTSAAINTLIMILEEKGIASHEEFMGKLRHLLKEMNDEKGKIKE